MKQKTKKFLSDKVLFGVLLIALAGHYIKFIPAAADDAVLAFVTSVATLPVVASALRSLKNKKVSIDLLASVALAVSILNKEWASATFINLMLTSARIFADYTQSNARLAIKSLLKLRPEKVRLKKGSKILNVKAEEVKKGDLLIIEAGERVPADGIVVSGDAFLDQSSLTGESLPVSKSKGDKVLSSTLSVSGSLIVRAERVGKDTAFEKIIKLVEESQENKVGIQSMADKFASWYIAFTLLGALALYFFSRDLRLVLSVLLVTCADDIAVAVPLAFSVAVAVAAKNGIIIKGGAFLEGLTKVKTIVFDKTGTLTKGNLQVDKIVGLGRYTSEDVLKFAMAAELFSQHPIAKAVVNYAQNKKIAFGKNATAKEFSGKGVIAKTGNKEIVCGKLLFLRERKVLVGTMQEKQIEKLEKKSGESVLFVSYDGKLAGYILFADELRQETKGALLALKKMGVKDSVMLTGDNTQVARKIARKLGIAKYHANLLPEDKLGYIKKYLNPKYKVAMVGDGVNDAASLAQADIGIAMGVIGSDVAVETADVALMQDDFAKIPQVLQLGKKVLSIARQDFVLWGVLNVVGLGLVFFHLLGPQGAAAFNFLTDFIPIFNSLRLFGYRFDKK